MPGTRGRRPASAGRTLDDDAAALAGRALWDAWREHARLEALPAGAAPQTIEDGYAVQDAMCEASGLRPIGWKVGATNRAAQQRLSLDGPLSGRLLAPFCFDSPAAISASEFAMRALEPEIAFRLGASLPRRDAPYRIDEVAKAVASAHPALEIPDTRLARWDALGAPAFIADNAAAGRFVLGAATACWSAGALPAIHARLIVDGEEIGDGHGADVLGSPLAVLAWLADHLPTRGEMLRAGDLVTTGTCTPIGFADPGSVVVADFGDFGSARVHFVHG